MTHFEYSPADNNLKNFETLKKGFLYVKQLLMFLRLLTDEN